MTGIIVAEPIINGGSMRWGGATMGPGGIIGCPCWFTSIIGACWLSI